MENIGFKLVHLEDVIDNLKVSIKYGEEALKDLDSNNDSYNELYDYVGSLKSELNRNQQKYIRLNDMLCKKEAF